MGCSTSLNLEGRPTETAATHALAHFSRFPTMQMAFICSDFSDINPEWIQPRWKDLFSLCAGKKKKKKKLFGQFLFLWLREISMKTKVCGFLLGLTWTLCSESQVVVEFDVFYVAFQCHGATDKITFTWAASEWRQTGISQPVLSKPNPTRVPLEVTELMHLFV